MAFFSLPTWQTLLTDHPIGTEPELVRLARDYYARQGRLLSAVSFLALTPAAASEPFLGNPQARELAGAPDFADAAAEADYWQAVVADWQQQVQRQLDRDGRAQQVVATWAERPLGEVLTGLYQEVAGAYPTAELATLPTPRLARSLWQAATAANGAPLTGLLEYLRDTADQVLNQNLPDADQPSQLLAALEPALVPLAQALVRPTSGQPEPVLTVGELTQPQTTLTRLLALSTNHPVAYALAEWFQGQVQQALQAGQPAPAAPLAAAVIDGQLLGADGQPLPGFTLRLTQQAATDHPLAEAQAAYDQLPRELGAVQTDAAGSFTLYLPRMGYLDAIDAVAELPTRVLAAAYYPGQATSEEPAEQFFLAPAAEGTPQIVRTSLLPTRPQPASRAVADVELPAALSDLLAAYGLISLADVREAGGVVRLVAEQLPDDSAASLAAQQLDGLARFEVLAADDATLPELVVAKGFYSPAQLLDAASQAEFVTVLTAADPTNDELRTQATAFYQRAAAAQALGQALGLLTAGLLAEEASAANAGRRPGTEADTEADADGAPAMRLLSADGSDDGGAVSNRISFPGQEPTGGAQASFNPVTTGQYQLTYQAGGQCDCPACRSAVSPTAYLASLLKYATQNLRVAPPGYTPGTPTTPTSGGSGSPGNTGNNSNLLVANTVRDLQERLLQPYCDLAISCQTADEPVCQYRLAIEVIQAYWRGQTPAAAALTLADARPYVEGVYEALLQAAGTSLTEVRALTPATRPAAAERLGLTEAVLTALQTATSPARLTDTRSLDAIEADLAELFGLASTAVDPLRTGLLLADPAPATTDIKLVRWSLQGIEYAVNTDSAGHLCIRVEPGTRPHVTVYAGQPTEDNVVARGQLLESDSVTHTFTGRLYPQHGSGLSGALVATVTGSVAATFTLSVVPAVTAGRQQALAASWLADDAAAAALLQAHTAPSWNGFTFLVDPDLLGPDDFRRLAPQADLDNEAYRTWRRRYDFLQTKLLPELLSPLNPGEGTTTANVMYYLGPHGDPFYGQIGINADLLYPEAGADALAATGAIGGLEAMLDRLPVHTVTYTGAGGMHYVRLPWGTPAFYAYEQYYQKNLSGTQALSQARTDYAGTTPAAPLAAAFLRSIGLSVDAAQRLYELWQRNRTAKLSDADLQEALDIVRQSVKKRFEADWTAEEVGTGLVLDNKQFQSALHEPQVGIWELAPAAEFGLQPAQLPRLDPELVTPLDLPDAGWGDAASQLWVQRQAELQLKRQALVAGTASATTAAQRADAMLIYAYRVNRFATPVPTATLPGTPPATLTTLEDVVAAAQNPASPRNAAALTYLDATLALRPEEAGRLVELRALVRTQPGDLLWQEMAALLSTAWKRAVAYRTSYVSENAPAPQFGAPPATTGSWREQEKQLVADPATQPFAFLQGTRKHRLVKWRADEATRAEWVQALALTGRRPLIDPDQLVPGDFRQAGERSRNTYPAGTPAPYLNPAFELYQQRADTVNAWYDGTRTSWQAASTAVARWQLITSLLRASQAELQALYEQRQAGVDVGAALRRLLLTPEGLDLLVTQAVGTGPDRSAEVPHLFTQVLRQRQYAAWQREELTLRVVPAPYYFRAPQAEAESLATQPWRSSAVARRQWQRTLKARFGQADSLDAAQQQAVKSAEDQYLPLLRDALLMARTGSPGASLADRASLMEDRFLLDFQAACCQHTTRVAQALEVLQKLFLLVRGGLPSNGLVLNPDDTTFEGDWQWLSSYERWRSLMFLYLYPQNVLLPALKPGQTSQFRQTVRDIRQGVRLTPADARDYMEAYQTFLTDMGTLQVATATQTTLSAATTDGFSSSTSALAVSMQVALANSRTAYANLYRLDAGETEPANFIWMRLPGTALVERIVGSAAYRPNGGERYIYVFALLREDQKNLVSTAGPALYLAFQRFSLLRLSWDDDYTRLSLSETGTLEPLNVQVAAGTDETWPPIVTGLRNRVVPHYTEPPFSLTATPNVSTTLDALVGRICNVDLFYATLDASGTSLADEQTKTFLMVTELTMLACTRGNRSILFYTLGVQVGVNNPTLLNGLVIDASVVSGSVYLASSLLQEFAYATPQTNPGGIGYFTSVFSTSFNSAQFISLQTRLRLILGGNLPEFRVFASLISPIPNSVSSFGYSTPTQLGTNGAVLRPLGSHLESTSVIGTSNGGVCQQGLKVYYTLTDTANPTAAGKVVDVFFSASWYQDSLSPVFYLGSSLTQVLFSTTQAISPLQETCAFIGPVLRSGQATEQAAVSPYPVRGYDTATGNRATIRVDNTVYVLCQALPALPPLLNSLTATEQTTRLSLLAAIQAATPLGTTGFVASLVAEAYYSLPMLLAQELVRGRNYELALHYYRLVYDYTRPAGAQAPDPGRLVYPALASAATAAYTSANVLAWLDNPHNPYTLAALRPNAHLEYVVMSVVRCLLAYADSEFTRDTTESVARARTYYELAARLLQQDIAPAVVPGTAALLDPFDAYFPAAWLGEWQSLKAVLARVNQRAVLEWVLTRADVEGYYYRGLTWLFKEVQAGRKTWVVAFDQAWQLVNGQLDALPGGYLSLCAATTSAAVTTTLTLPGLMPANSVRPYVPFLDNTAFCIPTNPVPLALALQAELNLFKIRSCRNIAGIQRELDLYAAATDTTTGLPVLSSTGQLVRSGRLVVPATQFRYAYVVERARNLVSLAQQTEASLLSALEKRDAEAYNLLKARQDIATSQATVQLQTLRITEAEDGVDLAGLQLERSEITEQQLSEWLSEGLSGFEEDLLDAIQAAANYTSIQTAVNAAANIAVIDYTKLTWQGAVAAANYAVAGVMGVLATQAGARASIAERRATYERREQEWKYQHNLAAQDIKIGQQSIRIANDQVKIRGQEKRIAQLQLDHATSVLNFLSTKFTNAELYDWMSGILENAYGYFLQQATATARLAEQQLAFERQQVPAGLVQEDYYSAPADDLAAIGIGDDGSTGASATDRKGLTGSVRLLQDLTRLDTYAFETAQRKLQLTKTISLAQSFPTEFVRFRDSGVLRFACQPEWFDQDFPGHYLRILRRVRTSVIALVPPVEGIKARLNTAGTSHVTVDGTPFQTLALPRAPEGVALTSPSNATGLFELEQQSTELLYPFEGLGVDVPWTFSMQPASNPDLDYSAVADVLLTLDYTALDSYDYARQVVQRLGTERQQQVVLSLRNRFADQWYDLHHADEVDPTQRYVSQLTITAADLPRSLRNASVSQVSVFVDAPLDEPGPATAFRDRSNLQFSLVNGAGQGGLAVTGKSGLVSTRTGTGIGPLDTGNATKLIRLRGAAPADTWTLTIEPGRLRERLAAGLITDIYLILEVTGDAPAYVL